MTRPSITSGVLAIVASLTAGAALAQDAPAGLTDAVTALTSEGTAVATYGDIDQDGSQEALVTWSNDCNEAGCLFGIVDLTADGGYGTVAYQYGQEAHLVSNDAVIDANGVYWTWNGSALLPWADEYGHLEFYTGRPNDKAAILKIQPWHKGMVNYDIKIANIDLVGDEMPERFMMLHGNKYAVSQASPWFIFDADDRLLAQGVFTDRPFLFHLTDRKGAAVITYNGSQFEMRILE